MITIVIRARQAIGCWVLCGTKRDDGLDNDNERKIKEIYAPSSLAQNIVLGHPVGLDCDFSAWLTHTRLGIRPV